MSILTNFGDAGKIPSQQRTLLGDLVGRHGAAAAPADHPAVAFLKALDSNGWHNLVRFDPTERRKEPIGLTIPPGRWDLVERFVAEFSGRENIYFSINEPKPNAPDKKLLKADIGAIRALPADIDLLGANGEAELARLQTQVAADAADLPAPTFVVDSGGGIQLHWRLAQKLPADEANATWAEDQARAIARELGGDDVGNVDRIMRLPGIANIPNSGKRAKGRIERQATLMESPGASHSPEMLRAALPPIPKATGDRLDNNERVAAVQAELVAGWADVAGAAEFDELPAGLRDRFSAAWENSPKLQALWEGEPPRNGDVTGSGYRAAMAQALARAGGFDVFDFAALAWVWDFAVQPQHVREERLTPRALARDWARIGETTPSASTIVERYFEPVNDNSPLFPETAEPEALPPFDFAAATRLDRARMDAIPERDFVLGSRFQAGTLTLGAGPAGVSKSTFAIKTALAIATGKPLTGETVAKSGPVLIYNAEDPRDEILRRIVATARLDRLDLDVVQDRVRILSGYDDRRLVFAERRERSGPVRHGDDLDRFAEFIRAEGIVHVALDPLVSLHRGLDENAASDMEALGDQLRRFASRTGVSVDLIHHTAKARGVQADANAGSADSARGSGAVVGFVRSAYTLVPMGAKFAQELSLDPGRAAQMVRLDDAKRNYARRSARERWFEITSVLPSGEVVPASDFDSHDEAVRRRASKSAGVHVLFDINRQRALASIAKADGDDVQQMAKLQLLVALMEKDEVPRVALAAPYGVALKLQGTQARAHIDALVPIGSMKAIEIEADGYVWSVWREEQRGRSGMQWVVVRKRLGQIVRPEDGSEASDDANGGVFD